MKQEGYKSGPNGKFSCPVCRYFTLEETGVYDICPVCFWEDDGVLLDDEGSGPNHMTLGEGKASFLKIGAVNEAMLVHVRAPLPDENPSAKTHLSN